jgi:hypothetical protein
MKWWRWTTVVAIAIALASRIPSGDVTSTVILETAAGIAILSAVAALRLSPSSTRGWGLIVAGLVCWWCGDVIWDIFRIRNDELPSVSLADVMYLVGYPFMAVGCVRLIRGQRVAELRDGLLDGIAFTGAASLAAWRFLVEPTLADGGSALERIVAGAYPLGDVLLLALVSWLALVPGSQRRPSRILAAFLGSVLLLDVAYALATNGDSSSILRWLDAAYPMTYTLPAFALMQRTDPSTARNEHGLHPARALFLGVSL